MKGTVLYTCRGFGQTHLARARRLIPWLEQLGYHVLLASSTEGALYAKSIGLDCEDLRLSDSDDHTSRFGKIMTKIIRRTHPRLVISDELFMAPKISLDNGIPTLFMACSLAGSRNFHHLALVVAEPGLKIIIPDWPEVHPDSAALYRDGRASFPGPLLDRDHDDRDHEDRDLKPRRPRAPQTTADNRVIVSPGSLHPAKLPTLRIMAEDLASNWNRLNDQGTAEVTVLAAEDQFRTLLDFKLRGPNVHFVADTPNVSDIYETAQLAYTYGGMSAVDAVYSGCTTIAYVSPSFDRYAAARCRFLASRRAPITIRDPAQSTPPDAPCPLPRRSTVTSQLPTVLTATALAAAADHHINATDGR